MVFGYYSTIRVAPLSTLAAKLDCSTQMVSNWLNHSDTEITLYYLRKIEKLYERIKNKKFDPEARMTLQDDCRNQIYDYLYDKGSVDKEDLYLEMGDRGFSDNAVKRSLTDLRKLGKVVFVKRDRSWMYQLGEVVPESNIDQFKGRA